MKIKVLVELVYETDPSCYPEGVTTPLEMVNLDMENDCAMVLMESDCRVVSAEEVKEESENDN